MVAPVRCLALVAAVAAVASAASSSSSGSGSGSASSASTTTTTTTTTSSALNTLTTSCNGGCSVNGACVVVGQSSANPIDCVNNTDCATLSSGQAALCMDAFDSDDADWVFQPGDANDSVGVAPFERVGLLQLDDQVTELYGTTECIPDAKQAANVLSCPVFNVCREFRRASEEMEPLSTALQLTSMNIQPDATLDKVYAVHASFLYRSASWDRSGLTAPHSWTHHSTFYNLSLSGASSALALNSVKGMYVHASPPSEAAATGWTLTWRCAACEVISTTAASRPSRRDL